MKRILYNNQVTFRLARLRCWMEAYKRYTFPTPASNTLRGALGYHLWVREDGTYEAFFAPKKRKGPSGLADPPRPFVLRAHHLDGVKLEKGEHYFFDLHAFDLRLDWIALLEDILRITGHAALLRIEDELVEVPLDAGTAPVDRLRVDFLTPAEIKTDGGILLRPEFAALAGRARDRVSGLRSLYGSGPLAADFRKLGRLAQQIRMTECDVHEVQASRRSSRTGQTHSLGGFVGHSTYEGELGEFLPILRAAEWTGIGRQTPWGKGAIAVRIPSPAPAPDFTSAWPGPVVH